MQWFKRCMVMAGRLARQGMAEVANVRVQLWLAEERHRESYFILWRQHATIWHRQANNDFPWERNQSEPRSLLTLKHFIQAKMSIVYLLLFAFALKSRNIPPFPDVPLCSSSSTFLRWTGDVGLGYWRKRSQRQLPLHFQPLSSLKNSRQE